MTIQTQRKAEPRTGVSSDSTDVADAVRIYLVKYGMEADDAQMTSEQIVSETEFDGTAGLRTQKTTAINAAIEMLKTSPRQIAKRPQVVPPSDPRNMRPAQAYCVMGAISPTNWVRFPRLRIARARA